MSLPGLPFEFEIRSSADQAIYDVLICVKSELLEAMLESVAMQDLSHLNDSKRTARLGRRVYAMTERVLAARRDKGVII